MSGENKRGQIWVETVIYTLMALVMVAAVLAFVIPRVNEIQDEAAVEQNINLMQTLDNTINSVIQGGSGNKRIVDFTIRKGLINVNPTGNYLSIKIETDYEYGEIGETLQVGNLDVTTGLLGSTRQIEIIANYSTYNITYFNKEEDVSFSQSPTPYKFSIQNKGGNPIVIDISAV
jgi:type II secretory pathway pseudopilin PulG